MDKTLLQTLLEAHGSTRHAPRVGGRAAGASCVGEIRCDPCGEMTASSAWRSHAGVSSSIDGEAAREPRALPAAADGAAAAAAAAEVGFAAREVAALRERCAAAAAEAAALRGERETREAQSLYLRSVLVNAFETCMGFESIFPVLSFALKFTPEEVSRIVAERKRRSKEGGFVAVDAVG